MKIYIVFIAFFLASCGITPTTWTNAVRGQQAFMPLAISVQDCIADRPDIQSAITPAWNRMFDKYVATKDLQPNKELIYALAGAKTEIAEAKRDAIFIDSTIKASGLDCGEFVRTEWANINTTFKELETGVVSSERLVLVADYLAVFSAIVQGRKQGEVVRMPT